MTKQDFDLKEVFINQEIIFLVDKGSCEAIMSFLNVSKIFLEVSSLFTGKNHPCFIHTFTILP